jgi:SAM-dependent methyltransferase
MTPPSPPGDELPDPVVPPDIYTEDYYRTGCMGATAWQASRGEDLDPLYDGYAALAGIAEGATVVDLGCGRGEMLVAALRRGAARAVGVEYAEAAVELAAQTLRAHGVEDRARLHHGDVRAVPMADGEADLVTLLDVVEHLAPEELHGALLEARRILKPGGRVFVHTMPNRTIYDVTYRLQRLLRPDRWASWPKNPRKPWELSMHVNEMTVRSLTRAIAGARFDPVDVRLGDWIYTDFVPDERAKVTYHRLARFRLIARLGRGDLWADAVRP